LLCRLNTEGKKPIVGEREAKGDRSDSKWRSRGTRKKLKMEKNRKGEEGLEVEAKE
jgi:hypothetical protein